MSTLRRSAWRPMVRVAAAVLEGRIYIIGRRSGANAWLTSAVKYTP